MIKQFSSLEKILLTLVFVGGSLILFLPMQDLFIGLIALVIFVYLLLNPKICFYLVIFTIPIVERIRFLPISFSINDIMILTCIASVLLDIFINNKKISLKTSIDKWNILLFLIYLYAGITSIGDNGILTSFKFLEAIFIFYATVYLIRAKQTSLSKIIKVFIITGLFQASVGILQSLTGQFGAGFQSQRGYLGYLGIGSKTVWHAWGTFGGNGMLPEFLIDVMVLLLPFYKFIAGKKKLILTVFLLAIYMGYSKESIFTLLVCVLFYYYLTAQNKKEAFSKISFISIITGVMALLLSKTGFMSTVDETLTGRLDIWSYPISALTSNMKYLWFGAGLNSYWSLIDPLLPQNILAKPHQYMLAHNYYLLVVEEMGLIGAVTLFSFFIAMGKKFFDRVKIYTGYYKDFNIAAFLFVITIFTTSFFGQFYYATFTKVLIYIFFGMILSKEYSFDGIIRKQLN